MRYRRSDFTQFLAFVGNQVLGRRFLRLKEVLFCGRLRDDAQVGRAGAHNRVGRPRHLRLEYSGLVVYLAPHWPEVVRQAEFLASHSNIGQQAPSSSPSLASAASGPGASSVAPPELRGAPSGPHIDVAQASPKGDVVIAGRAEPGAKVALLDGGRTLLETATDPTTGEFVLLPPRLEAGTHRLSLRSTSSSHAGQSPESFVMTISVAPQGKTSIAAKPPLPALAVSQTEPSSSSGDASKNAATIVRGDTLWRISRDRLWAWGPVSDGLPGQFEQNPRSESDLSRPGFHDFVGRKAYCF